METISLIVQKRIELLRKYFSPINLLRIRSLLGLFIEPLISVIIVIFVWKYFVSEFSFVKGKDYILLRTTVLPVVWIFYATFARDAYATTKAQYAKILECIKSKDKDKYFSCLNDGLIFTDHTILAILSTFILGASMIIKYESVAQAQSFIGGSAYIFHFVLRLVQSMEDPAGGIYRIEHIPKEWKKI